jgi:hypothetical protein
MSGRHFYNRFAEPSLKVVENLFDASLNGKNRHKSWNRNKKEMIIVWEGMKNTIKNQKIFILAKKFELTNYQIFPVV